MSFHPSHGDTHLVSLALFIREILSRLCTVGIFGVNMLVHFMDLCVHIFKVNYFVRR